MSEPLTTEQAVVEAAKEMVAVLEREFPDELPDPLENDHTDQLDRAYWKLRRAVAHHLLRTGGTTS